MYKEYHIHICKWCKKEFKTLNPKTKCCSKKCTKNLWKQKVKILGHKLSVNTGRKPGCIPWNKNKKCPELSGKNNGFYGHTHSEETKVIIKNKVYETKYKNNSFHVSKEEQKISELLLKRFPNLKTQYKSEKYPFNCDFYIPELDLYIEYKGHWTHGIYCHKIYGNYDKTNLEHINLLKIWEEKHTKYFDKAIYVWTILDPLKLNYIKQHDLNYIEFFTISDFIKWYNSNH